MRLLLALPIFITLATMVSFGQKHEVTEAELKNMVADAAEKRKAMSVREKNSTTGYNPGTSSESVFEFGPNETSHYVVIRRTKSDETKTEGITIGSVRYTRRADGSWVKETTRGGSGGGSGSGNGNGTGADTPQVTIEIKYVGEEKLAGEKALHYRNTHTVIFPNRPASWTRITVRNYWFTRDGLLLMESLDDNIGVNRYKSTTEYEYDKNIVIIAPIPD